MLHEHHIITKTKQQQLPLKLRSHLNTPNAYGFCMNLMLRTWERFSQGVSHVLISGNSADLHIAPIYDISNKMISPFYVFGLLVMSRLFRLSNGSIVVTIQRHWLSDTRNYTKFRNELTNPNRFLCCFRSSNVLSFGRRVCYGALLGTLPTYCTTIQTEDISRL